ncbi:hypothetical protein PG991_001214 [Apiospora marii]|uniref:ORC1/DEAH AAA+ ATPase domain-containing protein n=1 Tax=Apiospora marii TaxID=335849 RepID=A0ABR1SRF2_9PEZI
MTPPSSFGPIAARHALAGNQFSGPTNINFNGVKDPAQPDQPQACRYIPFPPNDDLVHRIDITDALTRLLPASAAYQSAALWGLGGSGKTQIALAYAYSRCRDPNCSVFWVHADTETSLAQDYKSIAARLGLPPELEGEDLLQAVRQQIEAGTNWVLVLDNADDLALFNVGRATQQSHTAQVSTYGSTLHNAVPRGPHGTILWTSRDQQIAGSLVGARQAVHIVQMTAQEATTLLETVRNEETKEEEREDVQRLLDELGCLPLPISQAAAYIRRTSTSIAAYLSEIQKRKKRRKLLGRSEYDRHRRPEVSNSMLETWDISVDHLRRENKMTYDILHVLAYLDNQQIPLHLIREGARLAERTPVKLTRSGGDGTRSSESEEEEDGDSDSDSDSDGDDYILEAITRLREFSFLSIRELGASASQRAYEMHKLVQEAARYRLEKGKAAYFARAAFKVVDNLFPDSRRETWPECEEYLVHAQQAGEWATLHKGEEEVAALLTRVSQYLYDRGRWREKDPVDKTALSLRTKVLGEKHPDTIWSMALLATTYHNQGRYGEAEKISVEVLGLRREVLGEKHPDTIRSMADLAATYNQQGRYGEAEKISVEVLGLRQEVLGEKHPDTIRSMASLATTYHAQGRYDEDEKISVEVLGLRREVLGEKHPDTIRSMADLAATYNQQGRYGEAEKISVEVLGLRQEVLGEKHPDTIRSMASLATTYHAQGRYDEDEKISVEVLGLRREVLGDKHPDTIRSMASLATTYHAQGRYDEDEKISVEVLGLRREVLGDKHPDTIRSMAELAATYHAQGRYDEDEKISVEVLGLRREVLGDKHPDTIWSMAELATTYHAQGRYDEAEKISVEVLGLRREVLGDKHPDTIRSMAELAATYHAQGRYDEDEKISVEVLGLRREVLGDKHPDTIRSMADLAATYHAQGRRQASGHDREHGVTRSDIPCAGKV